MTPEILKRFPSIGRVILYRRSRTNLCPGCGNNQWLVGRVLAECAVCATALPLAPVHGPRA